MQQVFLAFFLLGLAFVGAKQDDGFWKVNAWQAADASSPVPSDFPETSDENVKNRPNTGIVITGGGSRSFLASSGYLAALEELGLMSKVRYITGISGGAWFTMCYTYSQENVSDATLLGPILNPEDFARERLQEMDSQCMRRVTNISFVPAMLKDMKDNHVGMGEAWANRVQAVYMEPLGIERNMPIAWSQEQVADIRARNPSLQDRAFALPASASRPYPIVGSTLVGPGAGAPYTVGDNSNRNLSMLEMSPLYFGAMNTRHVDYHYAHGLKHTLTVGGAVEPYAFTRSSPGASTGLNSGQTSGVVSVPASPTSDTVDIAHIGAASSFAPGAFMDTLPLTIPENASLKFNYWSPTDSAPKTEETFFADGGCYENLLVTSMLQRRVEKIVLFYNVHTTLQPAESWNVHTDAPSKTQVARDLAAFFGVIPEDYDEWQIRGFDLSHNQVWPTEDWPTVITALQEAQASGNGVIATLNLTTVENTFWGIPSGISTQVTFVYLSRLLEWEKQLPPDMQELFVPAEPEDAADPSVTIKSGPFLQFPNYPTISSGENYERGNALASMTGWTIRNNAELFRSIFA